MQQPFSFLRILLAGCLLLLGVVSILPNTHKGVLESIIEIPAEKLWLSEEEVQTRKRNAGSEVAK